ncbi:MAG TPA: hypothetical protein VHX16_00460, partial [Chloroflexota bacterium]|nr:hypothetical protein [Chloroflexota bacterium]
ATVLDLPISGQARGSMLRFVKSLITGGRDSAVIAASLLAESMADKRMSEINVIMDAPDARNLNPITKFLLNTRRIILIPFLLWSLFGKMVLTVVGSLLMGQTIAWAWRTRRFLADATAIQLTRNPDGLGRGLEALAARGGLIPGGQWASHLFIVGGEAVEARVMGARTQRMREIRERVRDMPMTDRIRASMDAARDMPADRAAGHEKAAEDPLSGGPLVLGNMHPSLSKRLNRLRAQGANVQTGTFGRGLSGANKGVLALILVPLFVIVAGLMSVAIGLMTMLAFLAFEIGMGLVILTLVPGVN